jgi:beta-glucosidase
VTPTLERGLADGATLAFYDNPDLAGEPALVRRVRRFEHRWLTGETPKELTGRYSLRATATYTAQTAGSHRFTLTSAGRSRLFLDGALLVHNWETWSRGSSFYGRGSDEVGAEVGLAAGEPHELVVEFQSPPSGPMSGLIVGCREPEPADLFERAVALAAECDAALVVVGLNAGWEGRGRPRRPGPARPPGRAGRARRRRQPPHDRRRQRGLAGEHALGGPRRRHPLHLASRPGGR